MSGELCVPRVGQSTTYPHGLEMFCWEHGQIAAYGGIVTAAQVHADAKAHAESVAALVLSESTP